MVPSGGTPRPGVPVDFTEIDLARWSSQTCRNKCRALGLPDSGKIPTLQRCLISWRYETLGLTKTSRLTSSTTKSANPASVPDDADVAQAPFASYQAPSTNLDTHPEDPSKRAASPRHLSNRQTRLCRTPWAERPFPSDTLEPSDPDGCPDAAPIVSRPHAHPPKRRGRASSASTHISPAILAVHFPLSTVDQAPRAATLPQSSTPLHSMPQDEAMDDATAPTSDLPISDTILAASRARLCALSDRPSSDELFCLCDQDL